MKIGNRLEIIEEGLDGWSGTANLVRDFITDRYFVVSGVTAPFTGWEVLVFPYDIAKGDVIKMLDVAGGKGITFEEAYVDLERYLNDNH